MTLEESFWSKVDKSGGPDACWTWTGYADGRGYGRINGGRRGSGVLKAHRVSYSLASGGPIPDGKCVLHRCDNPPCVNPAHLFLGSQADNMADMASKGRVVLPMLKGEMVANAKLSESVVRSIRAEYAAGATSHLRLARKHGVSETLIRGVVRRDFWSHVE